MEDLQTDTLTDYNKTPASETPEFSKESENLCGANLLNGSDELDPLDLMADASLGSNSDVWKGTDSEDDSFETKKTTENGQTSQSENIAEKDTLDDPTAPSKETEAETAQNVIESEDQGSAEPPQDPENEKPPEKETSDEPPKEQDPLAVEVEDPPKTPLESDNQQPGEEQEEPPKNPLEGRPPNRGNDDHDDDCEMDYDAADDDDFDPSLLCPEVSMDVDDNPVITTNGSMPGCESPLPYEPLFSTFVDDVTGAEISFNLTPEELELKKRLYGPTNPIQYTRIHCTACNVHLGSALEGQSNRFVHPLLKVLICKECYHFYTSGEFEKDEDGSELYCRWCGQGGQVLCCSKCEFVFCKRCIRTNFGRKKMFEIRDSDSWECFRCNSSQLITQRIACYEFFEYIRREMSWMNGNNPEVWSRDYSRCCGGEKKRPATSGEEKKAKRKKWESDPDYNPNKPNDSKIIPPDPLAIPGSKIVPKPPIQIVPRYTLIGNKTKDNDIEFVRQIPAPFVTINPTNRPQFRTILPSVRPVPQAPTSTRILSTALQNRNLMKHEWFEKTVRAAARVNSHLSYTLTQLNKAQSQAGSVEELAVVHNKLQEILSSSINSLIQIRKNLRTEFITGIKTVRLPSKKPEFQNDDDVIIVSASPVMPKPAIPETKTAIDPVIIIEKATNTVGGPPKGFLKVKSVSELQNVPPECITIPDDPPDEPELRTFLTEDSSLEMKKMKAVRVILVREDLEKLQRQLAKES
ncbi:uncharacterized protein LOC123004887 isoform X2 [Tribolium madens]|uniref:uncharacterized protein LOC123004887 isoform X2 n=1 Tax=Tribolium madens TaxID=41895 RepID=UPI001CF72C1F|nr:uncharacterized protein LOC123004887 isoform X2 [Tribolium madens]